MFPQPELKMADAFCCLINNVITRSSSTMATGIGPNSGCHNNPNLAQERSCSTLRSIFSRHKQTLLLPSKKDTVLFKIHVYDHLQLLRKPLFENFNYPETYRRHIMKSPRIVTNELTYLLCQINSLINKTRNFTKSLKCANVDRTVVTKVTKLYKWMTTHEKQFSQDKDV